MQVSLEPDHDFVMGLPYGSTPDRQFWDLKTNPDLIDRVPELADDSTLKEFVASVNHPDTAFVTLGCEKWIKDMDLPNGVKKESGCYVDVMYNFGELAVARQNYVKLYEELLAAGQQASAEDQFSGLTLIRVEPGEVILYDFGIRVWKMSLWISGAGRDEEQATGYRDRGFAATLECLDHATAQLKAIHRESHQLFGKTPI